jgi:hypothetical protein
MFRALVPGVDSRFRGNDDIQGACPRVVIPAKSLP